MRAAIYARVSKDNNKSDRQEADTKSVQRQEEGAREFVRTQKWTLDEAHIYRDNGVSGALWENRPEFQRMMSDAGCAEFDAIVIFDLDRFGRDSQKSMAALNELADLDISVWDFSSGQRMGMGTLEDEIPTYLRTQFAQQQREKISKHNRSAARKSAQMGYVTGGKVFGYDNVGPKQAKRYQINPTEAAVVVEIYSRAAAGEGCRSISKALNAKGVPAPRAQQGRPSGWSLSTVHAVLERPLYRGEYVWGRTRKAWGRQLGKKLRRVDGREREKGQLPAAADQWIRIDKPEYRIIDPDLAKRVDTLRQDRKTRYLAAVAKGGQVPQRAHGKYLLSGGLLVCPTCGGHFEARKHPWKGSPGNVYICSTRRRKPGICSNTLALPIEVTDNAVLEIVAEEMLGTRYVDTLLSMVQDVQDLSAQWQQERTRLQSEISNLVDSLALGIKSETIAPKILQREKQLDAIEAKLRIPRPSRPDIDKLRGALLDRADGWREELRAEPKVARLVLRRLVGPLMLWNEAERPEWCKWEASAKVGILDGLVPSVLVASPTPNKYRQSHG